MNPSPLIDPRLRPHLDALLDAADEVIEDCGATMSRTATP